MSTAQERLEAEKERIRSNMGSILVHTSKQPVVWLCPNPECRDSPGEMFSFVRDEAKCPKCSIGPPAVTKQVLIHYIIRKNDGLLLGQHGLRYAMACDYLRQEIATVNNGEAGSGDFTAVNCPGCMQSDAYRKKIMFGSTL